MSTATDDDSAGAHFSGTVGETHAATPGEKNGACDNNAANGDAHSYKQDHHQEDVSMDMASRALPMTETVIADCKTANNEMVLCDAESCAVNNNQPNDFLLQTLDAIELRVEKMRETARSVEDEKMNLLDTLNTMMQSEAIDHLSDADREELGLFIDRLVTRCLTVDVVIQTVRTASQEQSLAKVRSLLRDLVDSLQTQADDDRDVAAAQSPGCRGRRRLELYRNSCLGSADESGPVDERFQGALLGCAAEDQKQIKRKLREMRATVDHAEEGLATTLQAITLDL